MLKKILLAFTLLFFGIQTQAQQDKGYFQTKERLSILLKERNEKFSRYMENMEKRSGIFGNQTKKDLRKVNEVLIEITETDNTLFKELKQLLDYKTFEKANAVQDLGKYEIERKRCVDAIDTLNKQITVLKVKNMDLKQEESTQGFLTWIFAVFLLVMTYFYWKAKTKYQKT